MIRVFTQLLGADAPLLRRYLMLAVAYGVLNGLAIFTLVPVLIYLLQGELAAASLWLVAMLVSVMLAAKLRQTTDGAGMEVGAGVLRNGRHHIGDHVATLPIGWFNPDNTARLSHLVSNGMMEIAQLPAHLITPIVSGVVAPMVLVGALLVLNPALGLIALIALPIIAGVFTLASRLGSRADTNFDRSSAQTSQRIVEFAQAQSVLRAFSGEGAGNRFLEHAIQEQRSSGSSLIWATTASVVFGSWVVQMVFAALLIAAALWLNQLLGGGADPASTMLVMVSLILIVRFVDPLQDVANYGEALRSARSLLDTTENILSTKPLTQPKQSELPADGSVAFHKVSFGYQEGTPVLKDISLQIPAGSMTALVGASGSGKSTLVSLIARFFDVSQGKITIGGVDVRNMTEEELNKNISQIFQNTYLFQGSIKDNILLGKPNASLAELNKAIKQAGISEMLERLPDGLDTAVGEGGMSLSGGERQRISIARALIKDAPILLVDEATAALDAENQAVIADALSQLKGKRTMLIIAHQLSTISMADRIVVLENGHIAEQGLHEELKQQDGLYSHFLAQREKAKGWHIA